MITKYCGKEEKLLLRSNFSSFPLYFQYLKLKYICSPITYLFMKCGCSIYYFFNSANLICRGTDISKYLKESLGLPDQESRLFLYDGVCLFVFCCCFFVVVVSFVVVSFVVVFCCCCFFVFFCYLLLLFFLFVFFFCCCCCCCCFYFCFFFMLYFCNSFILFYNTAFR